MQKSAFTYGIYYWIRDACRLYAPMGMHVDVYSLHNMN